MSEAIGISKVMEPGQTLQERLLALKPQAIDEFSCLAIDGAQHALADNLNPLRFNFFSTAARILFEHMMDKLAPIDQVKQCTWFLAEKEHGNSTRGQRIAFAIQGGLADTFVKDQLNVAVHQLRTKLIDAVDDLSKHVHGREETIISGAEEQDGEAHKAIDALQVFLTTYHECRSAIVDPIREQVDDVAINALISETILEVDELASHHSVDEVYVNNVSIDIGTTHLTYLVTGIHLTLITKPYNCLYSLRQSRRPTRRPGLGPPACRCRLPVGKNAAISSPKPCWCRSGSPENRHTRHGKVLRVVGF
jgi:hypothetical protein